MPLLSIIPDNCQEAAGRVIDNDKMALSKKNIYNPSDVVSDMLTVSRIKEKFIDRTKLEFVAFKD